MKEIIRGLEVAIRQVYSLPFGPLDGPLNQRKTPTDSICPITSYDSWMDHEIVDFAPGVNAVSHLEYHGKTGHLLGGFDRRIFPHDSISARNTGLLFLYGHLVGEQLHTRCNISAGVHFSQERARVFRYFLNLPDDVYIQSQENLSKFILDLKEIADDLKENSRLIICRTNEVFQKETL